MELNIFWIMVHLFLGLYTEATFKKSPKIINGVPTSIKRFPFMVKFINFYTKMGCAANIISERYALTAAHCTEGIQSPGDISLEVGTSYWHGHGVRHTVRNVIDHRGFNLPDINNDISLLEVNKRFQFNRRVQPIAIYPYFYVPDESKVTVVGWGKTDTNANESSPLLMRVEIEVWPQDECRKFWYRPPSYIEITDKMICTGRRKKKGGVCDGDSGGPLIYMGRLIGIASFSYVGECGEKNIPAAIYTRVAAYKCWIDSIAFNQRERN